MNLEPETVHEQSDKRTDGDTNGIGCKVKPVTIAVACRAVLLKQFQQATHQDRTKPGIEKEFLVVKDTMTTQVFPPDDATGSAIHDEVRPFVNKSHLVEGCLGEKRG